MCIAGWQCEESRLISYWWILAPRIFLKPLGSSRGRYLIVYWPLHWLYIHMSHGERMLNLHFWLLNVHLYSHSMSFMYIYVLYSHLQPFKHPFLVAKTVVPCHATHPQNPTCEWRLALRAIWRSNLGWRNDGTWPCWYWRVLVLIKVENDSVNIKY